MKRLKQLLFSGFLLYTFNLCLWGARFDFPGMENVDIIDEEDNSIIPCKRIHLKGVRDSLYFPVDGTQPHNSDVGKWSGANHIQQYNDKLITNWWISVFGGDQAVILSGENLIHSNDNTSDSMKEEDNNIIQVEENDEFKQQFWQTFRIIASDPVGRALLYRLLIEIKHIDDLGNSCCEDGIILPPDDLNGRNNCRNIHICLATDGCSFDPNQYIINFIKDDTNKTTTLKMEANHLKTGKEIRCLIVENFNTGLLSGFFNVSKRIF